MLKHGILGLLNYTAMTGYEIKEVFEKGSEFFDFKEKNPPPHRERIYLKLLIQV